MVFHYYICPKCESQLEVSKKAQASFILDINGSVKLDSIDLSSTKFFKVTCSSCKYCSDNIESYISDLKSIGITKELLTSLLSNSKITNLDVNKYADSALETAIMMCKPTLSVAKLSFLENLFLANKTRAFSRACIIYSQSKTFRWFLRSMYLKGQIELVNFALSSIDQYPEYLLPSIIKDLKVSEVDNFISKHKIYDYLFEAINVCCHHNLVDHLKVLLKYIKRPFTDMLTKTAISNYSPECLEVMLDAGAPINQDVFEMIRELRCFNCLKVLSKRMKLEDLDQNSLLNILGMLIEYRILTEENSSIRERLIELLQPFWSGTEGDHEKIRDL